MKTIIAGTRSITNLKIVYDAIKASRFTITEVVSDKNKVSNSAVDIPKFLQ